MKSFIYSGFIFLFLPLPAFSAIETESGSAITDISYDHILNWSSGLIIVLSIFFACIWFVRKMGVLPANGKDNMRVISALSVGTREKIVLVQVGEKQLLLGVAPGSINKILVLEDDERLFQQTESESVESDFSQKIKQIISKPANE